MERNEFKRYFANKFRTAVEEKRIKYIDIAKELSFDKSTVSCWANPENPNFPPHYLMPQLAKMFDKSVSYFYHEDDPIKIELSKLHEYLDITIIDDSEIRRMKEMKEKSPSLWGIFNGIWEIASDITLTKEARREKITALGMTIPDFSIQKAIVKEFGNQD
jgi:transcriptional regulator with XRE-family HTH domain